MRAVQFREFGGPIEIVDLPEPMPPMDGVVIKVAATGLCRSDWHGWQGHDSDITVLPHIPGHEFAGTISAVGAAVSKWAVGDRVMVPFVLGCGKCQLCASGNAQVCEQQWQPGFNGPGAYAEFVALPRADFNLVALPDEVDAATAASLGCRFATSYRAVVDVGQVQPGEWVCVWGCGGVGLAAIMIAAAHGAKVIAVDVNPEALAVARSIGASAIIDAQVESAVDRIMAITDAGADMSIDALGNPQVARDAVLSLRTQGRHVQVGLLPAASVGDKASVPMHRVIAKELAVLGSHGMSAMQYPRMLAEIAEGKLRPDLLISREISLDQTPAALGELSHGSTTGVTIIRPNG